MFNQIKQHQQAIKRNIVSSFEKGRAVPVGTVSNGYKKVAEGKWQRVTQNDEQKRLEQAYWNVSKPQLASKINKMKANVKKLKREDKTREPGQKRSIYIKELENKIKLLTKIYHNK